MTIVISPFSNSPVRDWPAEHFAALIGLLIPQLPVSSRVRIVGAPSQALRADQIVRAFDAEQVSNDCGRLTWPETIHIIATSACVIGNNSGIAHLAAGMGAATICIFGGSHQRDEWRPVGEQVTVISRAIWCSPCHLDRLEACPFNIACLRAIEPAIVARAVIERIAEHPASAVESQLSTMPHEAAFRVSSSPVMHGRRQE